MKMKTAVDAAIFEKVLVFSLLRTTEYSPGDLVNLLIVDTLKIFDCIKMLEGLIAAPILLLLSTALMYTQVGISFLGGFIMFGFMAFIGFIFTSNINIWKNRVMKKQKKRVKMVNEIFNNIKVIKMNGWEELFNKKLNKVRAKELSN